MSKTIIEELNGRAIIDPYLYKLLRKIQLNFGLSLFNENINSLTNQEFFDILRFSDILSRSEKSLNRNIALKIISTMFDMYEENEIYQLFAKNVVVKLGNFPSLYFLEAKGNNIENDEIVLDKIIKQTFQKSSEEGQYFTDSQYNIFNQLVSTSYYSFSASTSFGKSFLFVEYLNKLISLKNGTKNYAFLVPTRALISQVTDDIANGIHDPRYEIVQNPEVPALYRNKKIIFIFTPERLISYFSKPHCHNISTLIIDEAHNTVSDDERSPIFYHAISLARQKEINLFFASPNVANPDLFLQLIGKSTENAKRIDDLNVVQNKFFIDLTENYARIYFDFLEDKFERINFIPQKELSHWIIDLSQKQQTLIYCNSTKDTVEYANEMFDTLEQTSNKELEDLADYIRTNIHSLYYLANFLEKGIAFHFGALPQIIRLRIENLFKKGLIKYLFTTSTLLQGVNLPAKNIFILTDKIGQNKNLSDLDFRNLIGRAGRLSKELFGNIFIIKNSEKKWSEKSQTLLESSEPPKVSSKILDKKNQNFYINIGNVIMNKDFTKKNMEKWRKKQLIEYAGILTYHSRENLESVLFKEFSERNQDSSRVIEEISKLKVSNEILLSSVSIKTIYQDFIIGKIEPLMFVENFEFDYILKILEKLSKEYNWNEEEDKRELGNKNRYGYYATLVSEWLKSKPLNAIIGKTINYMARSEAKIVLNNDWSEVIIFNKRDPVHVNHVINELMKDIENIIRFKIKNYILNYLKLTEQEDSKWQNYIEYGTNIPMVIELQKLGFERQASLEIHEKCNDFFNLSEENEILGVNLNKIDEEDFTEFTKTQIDKIFGKMK